MMIELLCRYAKKLTPDEEQEIELLLNTQAIIDGDDFDKVSAREKLLSERGDLFEYGEFTFNLKDVMSFNLVDSKHTCIRFYNGAIYTYKIDYESFRSIYQTLTGTLINDFNYLKSIKDDKQ